MAIKSNVGFGPGQIGTGTDGTTVINVATITGADRVGLGALSIYNTTASTINVEVYISTDTTVASGTLLDTIALSGSSEAVDVNSMLGQGFEVSQVLILKADAAGANYRGTYTEFSGDD